MTAPNHITGGFAVTGVIAALLNINILENKLLIAVVIIASLLPDIDHTKSLIGKMCYPLAKFLQRHYGHRTITHSLLALGVLSLIVSLIQQAYYPETPISTVFSVAYASHLILDMITLQGIPLLYPFKRNPFVVPGNPNLRFETNNVRHEMLAFSFFLVLGFSMKPLMANGFWTSYNSLFGTLKHLTSEYHKSQDLIRVQFKTQTGSEITQHEGLCIEVDENHLVTITKTKQFRQYDSQEDMITDVFPRHTKMRFQLVEGTFQNITPDSLLHLFNTAKYTQFNIQGSKPFHYEYESIVSTHTTLKLDYPNTLTIRETKEKSRSKWIPTQKAAIKKREMALLQKTYQEELVHYQAELNHYTTTKHTMETTTNYIDKEILMERFATMRLPTPPKSIQSRLERLQLDLEGIKASEHTRYQNHLNQATSGPLLFNGTFTKLQINGKDI